MKRSILVAAVAAFAMCGVSIAQQAGNIGGMPQGGVCAHRGNDGVSPENTVVAWSSAVRLGVEMVELDVKRCKTGELVIMHDATVDRTTNGKGKVSDLTFAELRSLRANYRNGKAMEKYSDVLIPTFEEALDAIASDANVWINCHCAANTAVEAAKIIKAKGRIRQAFIATSLKAIADARKEVPEILTCNMSRPKGFSYSKPWPQELSRQYARETIENKCDFIQLLQPCGREEIEMLHNAGVKVSYFKCDDPARAKKLFDLGVDFILTDKPETIRPR